MRQFFCVEKKFRVNKELNRGNENTEDCLNKKSWL